MLGGEELKDCKLCFKQTIPSGLFVNQDQIWELVRLGKVSTFLGISLSNADVETAVVENKT